MSAREGPTSELRVRATVAVAVLRTLRAARAAEGMGRPMGRGVLVRLYLRHRSELEPEATPTVEDPGGQFVLEWARARGPVVAVGVGEEADDAEGRGRALRWVRGGD